MQAPTPFPGSHRVPARGVVAAVLGLLAALLVPGTRTSAQVKSPAESIRELEEANEDLRTRLDELMERVGDLERDLSDGKGEKSKDKDKDKDKDKKKLFFSDGLLTIGGVKLQLGGKAEFLFIKTEAEDDPIVGATENPDPHFEIDRFRLEPSLVFNKEVSLGAWIDFHPLEGETLLKELVARYDMTRPVWWFGTEWRFGLDDRFIRPARRTKNYPLLGNSFWRRESVNLTGILKFGDKRGNPDYQARTSLQGGEDSLSVEDDTASTESFLPPVEVDDSGLSEEGVVVLRGRKHQDPFNFGSNTGQLSILGSIGNGFTLDSNEIGFDGAHFDDIVMDDRHLEGRISARELGVGLEYARDFAWLGELELIGFYYNDELDTDSLNYLQGPLTLRNASGEPIAGYGDSDSQKRDRFGLGFEYFLPASIFYDDETRARAGDGFRLSGQWMSGHDGGLARTGWYVQGSYRFSIPEYVDPATGKASRGLIARRYVRSFEPLVRFGELRMNVPATPLIPELWDRRQLLVGTIVEVTREVFLKFEYAFNGESTGASAAFPGPTSVKNDEFMAELLFQF